MSNYGYDYSINEESLVVLKEAVIETAEAAMVARQAIEPVLVDYGKRFHRYKALTNMGQAEIGEAGMEVPIDFIEYADTYTPLRKIAKGFIVTAEDLAAEGDIDTRVARSATRAVMQVEDELILMGLAASDGTSIINGLYDSATPTQAATVTWGDAAATPYEDVNALVGQMEAVGFGGPYKMFLKNPNTSETRRRDAFGNMAASQIRELHIDEILLTDKVTTNTGMLVQPGSDNAELVLAQDVTVTPPFPLPDEKFKINVVEWAGIVTYQPYSVGTLTAL